MNASILVNRIRRSLEINTQEESAQLAKELVVLFASDPELAVQAASTLLIVSGGTPLAYNVLRSLHEFFLEASEWIKEHNWSANKNPLPIEFVDLIKSVKVSIPTVEWVKEKLASVDAFEVKIGLEVKKNNSVIQITYDSLPSKYGVDGRVMDRFYAPTDQELNALKEAAALLANLVKEEYPAYLVDLFPEDCPTMIHIRKRRLNLTKDGFNYSE